MKLKKEQLTELKNLVSQFNKSLARFPTGTVLPNYLDLDKEIKRIEKYGINEFRRVTSSYKKMIESSPDVYTTKEGVNITLWEKNEIDKGIKKINKKRNDLLKQYQPSDTKGNLSIILDQHLTQKKNSIESISEKYFPIYSQGIIRSAYTPKRIMDVQYRENYLKTVAEEYGENSKLYNYVKKLSASKIAKGTYISPVLNIKFVYRTEDEDFESEILEAWKSL